MPKIIKLITGEDLIADVEIVGNKIKLKNPASVNIMMGQDQGSCAIVPWCPFTEQKEFMIDEDKIIFIVDADSNISNYYNERFGNGLITPPKSSGIIT